jgi:large subunit ribosomal protein L15
MITQQVLQRGFAGAQLQPAAGVRPVRAARVQVAAAAQAAAGSEERLRLHNLSPQEGSRKDNKRKGRGYGGHQVRRVCGVW